MERERPEPQDGFNFTEHERLYNRINHSRLVDLIADGRTRVHDVLLTSNMYGEFLFVTLSRMDDPSQRCITFYGLGLHEQREQWIVKTWEWYESYQKPQKLKVIENEEALIQIREREDFVRAIAEPIQQTHQAKLYEFLADLTDEDGALSELEDLGWAFFADTDIDNDDNDF